MNLLHLLDDAKCFEVIRAHRWPEGVHISGSGTFAFSPVLIPAGGVHHQQFVRSGFLPNSRGCRSINLPYPTLQIAPEHAQGIITVVAVAVIAELPEHAIDNVLSRKQEKSG